MSKGWHSQVGRPQPGPHETLPALQDFYQEVANPLMTSVAFEYPSNAVESVTQDTFRVFFICSAVRGTGTKPSFSIFTESPSL